MLSRLRGDQMLERTKLTAQPAQGRSEAMHPLRFTPPGIGLMGFNPAQRRAQCEHDHCAGGVAAARAWPAKPASEVSPSPGSYPLGAS